MASNEEYSTKTNDTSSSYTSGSQANPPPYAPPSENIHYPVVDWESQLQDMIHFVVSLVSKHDNAQAESKSSQPKQKEQEIHYHHHHLVNTLPPLFLPLNQPASTTTIINNNNNIDNNDTGLSRRNGKTSHPDQDQDQKKKENQTDKDKNQVDLRSVLLGTVMACTAAVAAGAYGSKLNALNLKAQQWQQHSQNYNRILQYVAQDKHNQMLLLIPIVNHWFRVKRENAQFIRNSGLLIGGSGLLYGLGKYYLLPGLSAVGVGALVIGLPLIAYFGSSKYFSDEIPTYEINIRSFVKKLNTV